MEVASLLVARIGAATPVRALHLGDRESCNLRDVRLVFNFAGELQACPVGSFHRTRRGARRAETHRPEAFPSAGFFCFTTTGA